MPLPLKPVPRLAALLLALGCHRVGVRPPADCAPPSDGAPPVDSTALARLAGTYELISVTTTRGWDGAVSRGRPLPDPAGHFCARRVRP